MKSILEGHEEFIVSHTRKEIMKEFGVNYNYVNNFCIMTNEKERVRQICEEVEND